MANINRVVLVGNLTRDPELRHTPSGTAVCSLRLAVNTRQKDGETGEWGDKPNYFDITVCGNQGESCAQYLVQGTPGRRRRPPRLARVGGPGRLQAPGGGDHRRLRAVPRQPRRRRGRRRAPVRARRREGRRRLRRLRSRRRHPLLMAKKPKHREQSVRRQRGVRASDDGQIGAATARSAGEDRRGGLQERQQAPPVHLRAGQDPLAPDHGRLPAPPEAGRRSRSSGRARWRSSPTSASASSGDAVILPRTSRTRAARRRRRRRSRLREQLPAAAPARREATPSGLVRAREA